MEQEFFFKNSAVTMHNIKVAAIGCMDFRLRAARAAFMESMGFADYDQVAIPGSCKKLVDKDCDQTMLAVDVALGLHSGESVMIFHHTDCGAYGGATAFDSFEDEIAFQKEQLRAAANKIIKQRDEMQKPIPKIQLFLEIIDTDMGGVRIISVE